MLCKDAAARGESGDLRSCIVWSLVYDLNRNLQVSHRRGLMLILGDRGSLFVSCELCIALGVKRLGRPKRLQGP